MMRIGVLGKGGAGWMGGLHYTFNLIRALRALPKKEQPDLWLFVSKADGTTPFLEIARLAKMCRVSKTVADDAHPSTESPGLARLAANNSIDLIFPCMRSLHDDFPIPWLAWVPDLQHRALPEFFSEQERERRDHEFRRIAADARLVVVSSECALTDFNRAYRGHKKKLRVLRFATVPLPQWFDGDPRETVGRFDLPPRYLMLPNQFWVHKNHRVAFEATKVLIGRGLNVHLVCTGKGEDPRRPEHGQRLRWFLKEHRLTDRVHLLGLIPRLDQIQLMRAATAIVQPSLFEGLSTAVEDARALGKRMFLSDIPLHREQNPDNTTYFNPYRPDLLAAEIAKAWDSLPDGPCAPDEEKASSVQPRRVRRYAREFLKIARELLRTYKRHPSGASTSLRRD